MGSIKILPPHEARKIAAGEVIDRPAHVVKELLENSLDAGATRITLHLEAGGTKLIRVVDNGIGMAADDALLAFSSHATSKISSIEDLSELLTFGFRGEALASVSAVSFIELKTKQCQSISGTRIFSTGSELEAEPCACPEGTDITIRDLFYNIPARKKFLKSSATEWRSIAQLVQAIGIAHPHVSFFIYHEGREIYSAPAVDDSVARIAQFFGADFAQHMLKIEQHDGENLIHACISQPQYSRYDRSQLFFIVNNRWVKQIKLSQAALRGYSGILPQGKFPAMFIVLKVPSHEIDSNVHPRKEEIQFLYPRRIEKLVEQTIFERLQKFRTNQIAERRYGDMLRPIDFSSNGITVPQNTHSFFWGTPSSVPFFGKQKEQQSQEIVPIFNNFTTFSATPKEPLTMQATVEDGTQQFRVSGQLHTTYIVLETPKGLLLVDQHAAHERILYDRFEKMFQQIPSIELLFPEVLQFAPEDANILHDHIETLIHHGIIIESIDDCRFVLKAAPLQTQHACSKELMLLVIGSVREFQGYRPEDLRTSLHHVIRAQMACKGAVKAGDVLDIPTMERLIRDLYKTTNPLICAHGRPTTWQLSLSEIERLFKRRH